jgi:hypothetical protein
MNNDGKQNYDKFRRAVAFVFGVAVLLTSLFFSKEGFSFKVENADIWWVGWVIAGAVSAAQFMFNTERRELDWTIVLVGVTAYVYSIWSNIQGWESLRGVQDYMNWAGGIFMDVFPEKAIAWSLGAIKVGDFVGNVFSILKNPEKLDEQANNPKVGKLVTDHEAHIRELRTKHSNPQSQAGQNPTYHTPLKITPDKSNRSPNLSYRPMGMQSDESTPNSPENDIPQFMRDAMWDANKSLRR